MDALRYLIWIGTAGLLLWLAKDWYARQARQVDTVPREVLQELVEDLARQRALEIREDLQEAMGHIAPTPAAYAQALLFRKRVGLHRQVPAAESRACLRVMIEAVVMARDGKVDEGYQQLLAGRRRALELRDEGKAWGDELARVYQVMLNRYLRRYVTDDTGRQEAS